jgi:hypothetical protein
LPAKKVELVDATAIGEVISSTITGFIAECWQNEDEDGLPAVIRPGFGSFLKAETEDNLSILAVVYNVITGPQDNNHRAAPLRMSREQLKVEQPHIFALLRTEIHAVTVGYSTGGKTIQHLPPQPPQVHDFVHKATDAEITELTESMEFLRLIAAVSAVPSDELLSATVRNAYDARGSDYPFLVRAGQALSHLYRDDYDRLVSVLRKLNPNR